MPLSPKFGPLPSPGRNTLLHDCIEISFSRLSPLITLLVGHWAGPDLLSFFYCLGTGFALLKRQNSLSLLFHIVLQFC